jgi:hypothetical protein
MEGRHGDLDTYLAWRQMNRQVMVVACVSFGCRQDDVTFGLAGLVEEHERFTANHEAHDANPDLPSAGPNSAIASQILLDRCVLEGKKVLTTVYCD